MLCLTTGGSIDKTYSSIVSEFVVSAAAVKASLRDSKCTHARAPRRASSKMCIPHSKYSSPAHPSALSLVSDFVFAPACGHSRFHECTLEDARANVSLREERLRGAACS